MKQVLLALPFLFLTAFYSSAQNYSYYPVIVYDINPAQVTPIDSCLGLAEIDSSFFDSLNVSPSSIVWTFFSGAIIPSNQMMISDLCVGDYFFSYYDSIQGTVSIPFSVAYASPATPCSSFSLYADAVATSDSVTCDGQIDVFVTGGTAPYTIVSSFGTTTFMNSNMCSGCYTFTVADAAGCSGTITSCVPNGDTLGNIIINNPNPGVPSVGNLGVTTVDSCIAMNLLDPNNIISNLYYYNSDSAYVEWILFDTSGNVALHTWASYPMPFDTVNGVYNLSLIIDCSIRDEQYLEQVISSVYINFSALTITETELTDVHFVNPFDEEISVDLPKNGNYELRLIDLLGHEIYTGKLLNESKFSFDSRQLSQGTYLLQIQSESQGKTLRLIKK
ncbi:MAG: T9SS type A sorting domain-containing protein [Bacteroidota bacterium]